MLYGISLQKIWQKNLVVTEWGLSYLTQIIGNVAVTAFALSSTEVLQLLKQVYVLFNVSALYFFFLVERLLEVYWFCGHICIFPWLFLRESRAILIHQVSKKLTQKIPFKLHGLPVSSVFHPTRSIFFISTKKNVRVYDLLKQKLIKKLETGLREVSSIAIHPAGTVLAIQLIVTLEVNEL